MKTMGNALPLVTTNISFSIFNCNRYSEYVLEFSGCIVMWNGQQRNISNLHIVRELGMTDPSITSLTADEYKEAYIFHSLLKRYMYRYFQLRT